MRRLEWIIEDGKLRDAWGSIAFRSCGALAGQGVVYRGASLITNTPPP